MKLMFNQRDDQRPNGADKTDLDPGNTIKPSKSNVCCVVVPPRGRAPSYQGDCCEAIGDERVVEGC